MGYIARDRVFDGCAENAFKVFQSSPETLAAAFRHMVENQGECPASALAQMMQLIREVQPVKSMHSGAPQPDAANLLQFLIQNSVIDPDLRLKPYPATPASDAPADAVDPVM